MEAVERLLARVEVTADGCWRWTGPLTEGGYGRFKVARKHVKTHRFMWEHYNQPIPTGLQIDHECRVRSCVNPDHLRLSTAADNVRRGDRGITRLVCPVGHWILGGNVDLSKRSDGRPRRKCRQCRVDRQRQRASS